LSQEPSEIRELLAEESDEGLRLDVFIAKHLPEFSRSQLRKMIDVGAVTCNGVVPKPKLLINAGDKLVISVVVAPPPSLDPIDLNLDILFEDEELIVINKPIGLTVHPGAGPPVPTLVHGLLHHCKTLSEGSDALRPGIVHRLDKDTSGVIVCAKTKNAHRHLAEQFQNKTNRRVYVALLDGFFDAQLKTVETWLRRDPKNRQRFDSLNTRDYDVLRSHSPSQAKQCKFARSHFKRLVSYGERLTLVAIELETGRTHQIRLHSKSLSLPVVGDMLYGRSLQLPKSFPEEINLLLNGVGRQLLHAEELGFQHPTTKEEMNFKVPIPEDFARILGALAPFADS
jgi:23S rRNA pseudouridine1911/1915/1917 synthase